MPEWFGADDVRGGPTDLRVGAARRDLIGPNVGMRFVYRKCMITLRHFFYPTCENLTNEYPATYCSDAVERAVPWATTNPDNPALSAMSGGDAMNADNMNAPNIDTAAIMATAPEPMEGVRFIFRKPRMGETFRTIGGKWMIAENVRKPLHWVALAEDGWDKEVVNHGELHAFRKRLTYQEAFQDGKYLRNTKDGTMYRVNHVGHSIGQPGVTSNYYTLTPITEPDHHKGNTPLPDGYTQVEG